jgi:O-antigen ligase
MAAPAHAGMERSLRQSGMAACCAGLAAAIMQYAGALKSMPLLADLPVDLTLASLALLLPPALGVLAGRRWLLHPALARPLLAAFALLLWLVIAALWSESRSVVGEKLPYVVLLAPLMLALGVMVGADAGCLRAFATSVLGIGLLVGAAIAWGVATDRVVLGGEVGADPTRVRVQYQLTGLVIAAAAGLAAVRAAGSARLSSCMFWLMVVGLCAAAVLVPGGRLGLIGLVAGVIIAPSVLLCLEGRAKGALLWGGGFLGIALFAVLLLVTDPGFSQGFRTLERTMGEPATMTAARIVLWLEALRWSGEAAPFGLGTGGFTLAAGFGEDRGFYPHNHALEALVEGGVPGLALWTLAFGGAAVAAILRAGQVAPQRAARICAVTLPIALSIMVSTDLGNRMAWFALGLVLSLTVEASPSGRRTVALV